MIDVKAPSPGESINEVEIARWFVKNGDYVQKGADLFEIDSDKATLTAAADASGIVSIKAEAGSVVPVGDIVATIDETAEAPVGAPVAEVSTPPTPEVVAPAKETVSSPTAPTYATGHPSVASQKLMAENKVTATDVKGTGKDGRITKGDVLQHLASGFKPKSDTAPSREPRREKMSSLRKKLSQRLVSVKNETAMLTTFNEVDMSAVMALRNQYKDKFKEKFGVGLGFMSFFTKAVTNALMAYPAVNAMIDGEEIVYFNYTDIGVAVSTPKGLMVPVVRNAEQLSLAEIEAEIGRLAAKARDGKITVDDMTGGTFTITNGGVFGSMMSTPILNPPQSAILGMHNIVERPIAVNGQVVIRPIMYIALSYDHRIIDGRESVGFLVKVKQQLEDPVKLLFGGDDPLKLLLGL